MKRGIITLTKEEINDLLIRVNLEDYSSDTLLNKMNAASRSDVVEVNLELSEDELEFVLDEIIIPVPQLDTEHTATLREKIQKLLNDFRISDMIITDRGV